WAVRDVVCSHGPQDRPFEEQHEQVTIAIVASGTFQYRASGLSGRATMTPGSVLLGSAGQCFECGHDHAVGDRCVSFHFTPEYFHAVTDGVDGKRADGAFRSLRLTPVPRLSTVIADAFAGLAGSSDVPWEELTMRLAMHAVGEDGHRPA